MKIRLRRKKHRKKEIGEEELFRLTEPEITRIKDKNVFLGKHIKYLEGRIEDLNDRNSEESIRAPIPTNVLQRRIMRKIIQSENHISTTLDTLIKGGVFRF